MRRHASHPRHPTRAALLVLAALAGSDCTDETGTPLPEPPDGLPRPEWLAPELVAVTGIDTASPPSIPLVPIGGPRDLVEPNTQVWAINLDNLSVPPVRIMANAQGGYAIGIGARDMQRVRILSRTAQKHSPPLDLQVTIPGGDMPVPSVQPLASTALSCLTLTPAESVVFAGTEGALTLENHCKVAVEITRAALRLGDQGMRLNTPPATIPAGKTTTLTFEDSVGPQTSERLDILLLEVDAGSAGTGRYAVDLFSDLE